MRATIVSTEALSQTMRAFFFRTSIFSGRSMTPPPVSTIILSLSMRFRANSDSISRNLAQPNLSTISLMGMPALLVISASIPMHGIRSRLARIFPTTDFPVPRYPISTKIITSVSPPKRPAVSLPTRTLPRNRFESVDAVRSNRKIRHEAAFRAECIPHRKPIVQFRRSSTGREASSLMKFFINFSVDQRTNSCYKVGTC